MSRKTWTVSRVARMANVSVRALHHYDEIGLLVPSRRSASGYRLYDEADLQRLRDILLFRQLGLSLEAIRQLLEDPTVDRRQALTAHRAALLRERRQMDAVLRAVDAAIDALEKGETMEESKLFDGFDEFDNSKYEEEARERWGHTDAYRESQRRAKGYSKEDWARIQAEADGVMKGLADLLERGVTPDSPEAMALAEQHRVHIARSFYPCDHRMHVALAEMYTADARFTEYFEKRRPGLAAFTQAAIRANAAPHVRD